MSVVASGTRVWLAAGTTDMRKGFTGLSALVQNALASSPFCGHVCRRRVKVNPLPPG